MHYGGINEPKSWYLFWEKNSEITLKKKEQSQDFLAIKMNQGQDGYNNKLLSK